MITNSHEYFEEYEIEHDFRTYYATGYVDFMYQTTIGTNYEGYAYEVLNDREIYDITLCSLWYYDDANGAGVDILNKDKFSEIEKLAEEVIRYKYDS